MSYKLKLLKFIDSARFMASSLSNFYDNLPNGIKKLNVNTDMITKNVKKIELDTNIANAILDMQKLKLI